MWRRRVGGKTRSVPHGFEGVPVRDDPMGVTVPFGQLLRLGAQEIVTEVFGFAGETLELPGVGVGWRGTGAPRISEGEKQQVCHRGPGKDHHRAKISDLSSPRLPQNTSQLLAYKGPLDGRCH